MKGNTKESLRKLYRMRKKEYLQSGKHEQDYQKVKDQVKKIIGEPENNILIGSYLPILNKELSPPLIQKERISYAYPLFSQENRKMEFIRHKSSSSYKTGPFGIQIPTQFCNQDIVSLQLDIVLVPLTCFTEEKHRIGYGGGYYDTFISHSRSLARSPIFVGIGAQTLKYNGQSTNIFDKWDQKLDLIVTEQRMY